MKTINNTEFKHFVHSLRNPLNSISLHAELGKMLIEGQGTPEEIKNAFEVILKQCKTCDQTLSEMRLEKDKPEE
jgi:signal transduction histidine kinase